MMMMMMMRHTRILPGLLLLLVLLLAAWASCAPPQDPGLNWAQFKQTYGKRYATVEEEAVRRENFERALKFIRDTPENPHGVTLGIHEYSDLSAAELAMSPASTQDLIHQLNSTRTQNPDLEYDTLPAHFDWRDLTQLNPISSQGVCGSCWSFATSFTVEAQLSYRQSQHVLLSKQELVDCSSHSFDSHYLNQGCVKGYPPSAYQYIVDKGLHEERVYPYNGNANEACYTARLATSASASQKFHIRSHNRLAERIPDATVMGVLRQYGPVVVVIHGTDPHFVQYKSGIIRNLRPNSAEVNHVVAVVGWGTTAEGVDYWVLRNSWGSGWGEGGYARLERGHNNLAFNNWVSYPIL